MVYFCIGDTIVSWEHREGQFLQKDPFTSSFVVSKEQAAQYQEQIAYRGVFHPLKLLKDKRPFEVNSFYQAYEFTTEEETKERCTTFQKHLSHTRQPNNLSNWENSSFKQENGKGRLLVYPWEKLTYGFAFCPEMIHANQENAILFHPSMKETHSLSYYQLFGVTGLHRAFLELRAPVLHASFVQWNGKGILFTAPSQTGKSTQADLWQRYAGAQIVNGDRVLVKQRGRVWHAFGYPACGSSKICLNQNAPLKAIIVLEQGEKNSIIPMTQAEKVRAIAAATEMYVWDYQEVEKAFSLAEQLSNEVLVFKLKCRPEREAVELVLSSLKGYFKE